MYCLQKGIQCDYANHNGFCTSTACVRTDVTGPILTASERIKTYRTCPHCGKTYEE